MHRQCQRRRAVERALKRRIRQRVFDAKVRDARLAREDVDEELRNVDVDFGRERAHESTRTAIVCQYARRLRRIGAQRVTRPPSTTKPAHRYEVVTRYRPSITAVVSPGRESSRAGRVAR